MVVDSRLDISPSAKVLQGGAIVFTVAGDSGKAGVLRQQGANVIALPDPAGKVDLAEMLVELAHWGVNEVLVEGGARLNGALLAAGLVDEFLIYQAPILIGDKARGMFDLPELAGLAGAQRLRIMDHRAIGGDLRLLARLR